MSKPKLQWLTLLLITVSFANGQSIPDTDKKIAPALLREDLNTLKNQLQTSQPGLYLYITEDSLTKVFNTISNSLTAPMTSLEFYRNVAPLNKTLKNLHTRLWPSAIDERATEIDSSRFPLDIYWDQSKMYVLRNHSSDERIAPGTIIKTINGQDAKSVFKKISDCRVRDGYNETYPLAQATRNFGIYYAQLIDRPKIYTLEIISPDGAGYTATVQGLTGLELDKSRTERYLRKYSQYCEDWDAWIRSKEPALKFEIKEDLAILKVHTFYLPIIEENGQQYEAFFDKSFAQMKEHNIKHLVIDLRNNHGGTDPVGMSLLSHLCDTTFHYYKRRYTIVKPNAKHIKKGNGYEIIGKGDWTGKMKPAKDVYHGKVYVLMNAYSVSAAGEFIGHIKNMNRAIFIGEEAGGNPVTFNGGESVPVDLPHTHITGTIPLQLVEMNVALKNTGHGVIPDYKIRPGINDIMKERDPELEKVLELINEQ